MPKSGGVNMQRAGTGFEVLWGKVSVDTLGTIYLSKHPEEPDRFSFAQLVHTHGQTFSARSFLEFWPLHKFGEIPELYTRVPTSP